MIIIFGAGESGQYIMRRFFENKDNLLFYDNDRRKWGMNIEGSKVIDFNEFCKIIKMDDTEIVIGTKNETAIFFLKDICSPENKIFGFENNKLVKLDLNKTGEFKRDIVKVERKKLKKYEEMKAVYEKKGNIIAYNHAVDYIDFKRNHLSAPEITGIELTNNCNLKCPNCPTPVSKRPKGFMNDEVFDLSLKLIPPYPTSYFSVHGLGEPLMHPKFIQYLEKIAEIDISTVISTNGILLDKSLAQETFAILKKMSSVKLFISFHTPKSVENWYACLELAKKNNIDFYGQVLEHNRKQAENWLSEAGIDDPKHNPYIRYITSHSFAGNVVGRKTFYSDIEVANRVRNCTYLRNNMVAVAWDGRLKSCCYDSENVEECGTIFDFERARIKSEGYKLCKNCDPDWTSDFQ